MVGSFGFLWRGFNKRIVFEHLQIFAATVSPRLVSVMQYVINVWVAALEADGGRHSLGLLWRDF